MCHALPGQPASTPISRLSDFTSQLLSPSPDFPELLRLFTRPFYWMETSQGQVIPLCPYPSPSYARWCRGSWCLPGWFSSFSGYMGGAYFPAPLQLRGAIWLSQAFGLWEAGKKAVCSRQCSYKIAEPLCLGPGETLWRNPFPWHLRCAEYVMWEINPAKPLRY